jgi:hypothetical protein
MAGSNSKSKPFIKTNLQSWMKKHEGIAAERDPEKHRVIRKQLIPAFNPRALKEQEPALHVRVDIFIEKLVQSGNQPKGLNMPEVRYSSGTSGHGQSICNVSLILDISGLTGFHSTLRVTWLMVMTLKTSTMV